MEKAIRNAALLDIETTGLSQERDEIVCIGLKYLDDGRILQWVQGNVINEAQLLKLALEALSSIDTLYICSQGNFDLAFLTSRLAFYDLDFSLCQPLTCISFYKLPFFKRLKEIGLGKRSDLENALGYSRSTQTNGKELAKLAKLHLQHPNTLYEQAILNHNKDELESCHYFYSIYTLITTLHTKQSVVSMTNASVCFVYPLEDDIESECSLSLGDLMIQVIPAQQMIRLTIPSQKLTLRRYLYPAKDYVYIPTESQLIHKSIAQFFPASLKQKVKQSDCFVAQELDCIPLWTKAKPQSTEWVDENNKMYIPLQEISSYQMIESKLIKYLTQG